MLNLKVTLVIRPNHLRGSVAKNNAAAYDCSWTHNSCSSFIDLMFTHTDEGPSLCPLFKILKHHNYLIVAFSPLVQRPLAPGIASSHNNQFCRGSAVVGRSSPKVGQHLPAENNAGIAPPFAVDYSQTRPRTRLAGGLREEKAETGESRRNACLHPLNARVGHLLNRHHIDLKNECVIPR